ncbi:hypothetical protein BBJ28_00004997 [Nothophytophthora sp. Chile5]|nr:hypothetical protein BBJ28_00004997 [Nothophytophthora sp. Chile5]
MERTSATAFGDMLDHPQFTAAFGDMLSHPQFVEALQAPQAQLHQPSQAQQTQPSKPLGFQGLMQQPMDVQEGVKQEQQWDIPAPAPVEKKVSAKQSLPDVLKNLMPNRDAVDLTPSKTETALLSLVDSELRVASIAKLPAFLKALSLAKTEPEQTLALVVLRATSTATNAKLAGACATAFEKSGGLRLARVWLESAVTWQHLDLLVLLLEVLQTLPLQLTSITEARINEPIVKLRKGAREERVKRAAQELLKFWRSKFTEKEKPTPSPAAVTTKAVVTNAGKSSPTASGSATKKVSVSADSGARSSPPAKEPKVVKKRTIKRLERLPFGGGSSVSKSSDLIGNLMQRKSAKDAAAAAAKKEKKSAATTSSSSSTSSNTSAKAVAKDTPSASDDSDASSSKGRGSVDGVEAIPLPTIQSFKAASSNTTSGERKRIRWADENGKELVKVKLIESWRDLVPHEPQHDDNTFRAAKLREHADERHVLLSQQHKVPPAVAAAKTREWATPALISFPEALAERVRRGAGSTDEMHVQSSRTRREIEYLVLNGEVPPPSPKEWERVGEPHRGAPVEIPLTDVAEVDGNNAAMAMPVAASVPMMDPSTPMTSAGTSGYTRDGYTASGGYDHVAGYEQRGYNTRNEYEGHETDEERAVRAALGPLQKSTIAVLLDNEGARPQVYEEARHRGNRIPDARVLEIVDQHRRARFQAPPPTSGFSSYGSQQQYGNMGPDVRYDGQYQHPPQQGAPFLPGKRNAEAMGSSYNGNMADMGPKRLHKKSRAELPCMFFGTPVGCKHGNNCQFSHAQAAPLNGPDLIYNSVNHTAGPVMAGRGAGPAGRYGPVGMRGGHNGGRHHMRGGR